MTTEAQAREMWCPLVRHEGDSGGTFNRGYYDDNPLNASAPGVVQPPHNGCGCIASKCAMWRWLPVIIHESGARMVATANNPSADTEAEAGPRPPHCDGWEFFPCDIYQAGWIEPQEAADARRDGYCGLAGNPNTTTNHKE